MDHRPRPSRWITPALLFIPAIVQAQFDLRYDGTVPVIRDGGPLAMPWAGGINFTQFSNIDLDQDGDLDMFVFDRSGDEVITLINDGAPGAVEYHYTKDFDHVYPFNELHDWALLRDYNCDGKLDIWSYSLGGARVFKNTTDEDGLSFRLVDTLVRTNYQPTEANLYITQVDVPGIEDIDNDGDLDLITFSIFGSYLEYHRNLSMELFGTCDSLTFELRNRCWGDFSENVSTNSVNLDVPCSYNVPNPEMALAIQAATQALLEAHHDPMAVEERDRAHVGSTILPIDLDGDRVKDLMLGDVLYANLVALYNDGTVDDAHMAVQDSTFPVYDTPVQLEIFPGAYYVDVDNDAKRDLVIGANNTSLAHNYLGVWHYRNTGTDAVPVFQYQDNDLFQSEMLDYGEGGYPVLFDHNGDGLMDLVVANYGYYQSGGNYPCRMALLENTGTSDQPEFTQVTDDFQGLGGSGIGQAMYPAFGDFDGDNDQDMYVGDLQGRLFKYINTPVGGIATFSLGAPPIVFNDGGVDIDVGQQAKPQFFDVDGDGKLDLLVGERNGNINYYRNTGSLTAPVWHLENDSLGGVVVAEYWNVTGYSVPHMFIDHDGDRELLVGSESGWIWNFGDIDGNLGGTFTLLDSTWQSVKEGGYSSVVLHDFDDDGWDDAVTGNYRGGITYWRNDIAAAVDDRPVLQATQAFTLAPNPTGASVEVVLNMPLTAGLVISVLDASGRVALRKPVNALRSWVDASTLTNGVYVVRLSCPGGQWSQRLVVLHR